MLERFQVLSVGLRPRTMALACAVVALAGATGCAGGRYALTADKAQYPISVSRGLEGPDHELLLVGNGLEKVGDFNVSRKAIGFLYSATPWPVDISKAANKQIEEANGEGLANLTLENDGCAINWFFPLTLLPIWPGCASVTIHADIVRRTSVPPSPGGTNP